MIIRRLIYMSNIKALKPWSESQGQIKMIKLTHAKYANNFKVLLTFSDGHEAIFDGKQLLKNEGPLLEALRDENYFKRVFIDAGALCWPNGLELSPHKLYDTLELTEAA